MLRGTVVFEPEYRAEGALKGIKSFSHLWLLWKFEGTGRESWSPTVRPPRLGGNERIGVFATRSPFRPNPIGLSSVRLLGTKKTVEDGEILIVSGADLMNGTGIYDIKPYLAYTDSHPDAVGGFTETREKRHVRVYIPEEAVKKLPSDRREALRRLLEEDPRPAYQNDPDRVYSFEYAGFRIRFQVAGEQLTVSEISPLEK